MKLLYSEKLKNKTTTRNIPVKCTKCSNFVMKLCLYSWRFLSLSMWLISQGENVSLTEIRTEHFWAGSVWFVCMRSH